MEISVSFTLNLDERIVVIHVVNSLVNDMDEHFSEIEIITVVEQQNSIVMVAGENRLEIKEGKEDVNYKETAKIDLLV